MVSGPPHQPLVRVAQTVLHNRTWGEPLQLCEQIRNWCVRQNLQTAGCSLHQQLAQRPQPPVAATLASVEAYLHKVLLMSLLVYFRAAAAVGASGMRNALQQQVEVPQQQVLAHLRWWAAILKVAAAAVGTHLLMEQKARTSGAKTNVNYLQSRILQWRRIKH